MLGEKDALMSEGCQQTSPDKASPISFLLSLSQPAMCMYLHRRSTSNETCISSLLKNNRSTAKGSFYSSFAGNIGLLEMWQLCFSRLQRPSSANKFCKRAVRFSYARCMDIHCNKTRFSRRGAQR